MKTKRQRVTRRCRRHRCRCSLWSNYKTARRTWKTHPRSWLAAWNRWKSPWAGKSDVYLDVGQSRLPLKCHFKGHEIICDRSYPKRGDDRTVFRMDQLNERQLVTRNLTKAIINLRSCFFLLVQDRWNSIEPRFSPQKPINRVAITVVSLLANCPCFFIFILSTLSLIEQRYRFTGIICNRRAKKRREWNND